MIQIIRLTLILWLCVSSLIALEATESKKAPEPFILGVYSADNAGDKNFQILKDAGINYVHSYSLGLNTPENFARSQRFLDLAQKYGFKVMFNLNGRIWVNDNSSSSGIYDIVKKFKDHPALGLWYIYDEPKPALLPKIIDIKKEINRITPNIPVSLVIHWIKGWNKTLTGCDWWMVDLYPVREKPFPEAKLSNYAQYIYYAATEAKKANKPLLAVMQSCSFSCFPLNKQDKYRFPNEIEMRNMAFVSIAAQVRGIFFFSFYHSHYGQRMLCKKTKNSEPFWFDQVMTPLLKEVKDFEKEVPEPWNNATQLLKNGKGEAFATLFQGNKNKLLVWINNTGKAKEFRLDLTPVVKKNQQIILQPWGSTKRSKPSVSGKIIKEKFQPWETKIWILK